MKQGVAEILIYGKRLTPVNSLGVPVMTFTLRDCQEDVDVRKLS